MTSFILDNDIVTNHLSKFLPIGVHQSFNEMLVSSKAVVSGSWSLYLVLSAIESGDVLQKGNSDVCHKKPMWEPNDMDIWITNANKHCLNNWLLSHLNDYTLVRSQAEQGYPEHIGLVNADFDIYYIQKKTRVDGEKENKIQVIDLSPIFSSAENYIFDHFDLSINKNFWNGISLNVYCLSETRNLQCIIQKRPSTAATENRIKKYLQRGFTLAQSEEHVNISTEIPVVDVKSMLAIEKMFQVKFENTKEEEEEYYKKIYLSEAVAFARQCQDDTQKNVFILSEKIKTMNVLLRQLETVYDESSSMNMNALLMPAIETYKTDILGCKQERDEKKRLLSYLDQLLCKAHEEKKPTDLNQNQNICPICADLTVSHALPCGHVFCKACASKVLTSNPRICFICRTPIERSAKLLKVHLL